MDPINNDLQNVEENLRLLGKKAEEKKTREAEFTHQANIRFENNLQAFKKYFPDIYDRFKSKADVPDESFELFTPGEKFQLLVNDNGSGNIIDYDTGVPMYSDDPVFQVKRQVEEVLKNPELSHLNFSALQEMENTNNFVHVGLMQALGCKYNQAKETLPANKRVDKHIASKVIFGIGLGYHLMPLLEATTANYISIFEPNEDYFFASLFCFDWWQYLEKVDNDGSFLYIGIGSSEREIYETLYQRAQNIGAFSIINSFFYQHYPSKSVARLIDEIRLNFHQFFTGWGFFDDALLSIAHTDGVLKRSPNIMKYQYELDNYAKNYPVFIVANGPSLDADIEKIKQMENQAVIIGCNSATTALIKHGIIPDFHVSLERTKPTYDFLKTFIAPEDRKKINLLTLNVMYPDVLDLFPWTGIALKGHEAGTTLYQYCDYLSKGSVVPTVGFCNPLVGNTALSFSCHLGFKNLYLFGVDSGYLDEEHHHSKLSFYYDDSGKTVYPPLDMGDKFRIDGNFGGSVITDPFLYAGKEQMERLLESFQGQNVACYNCSDGAKIAGTLPLRSENILLEPQSFSKQEIVRYVKENAFSKVDIDIDVKSQIKFDDFESICMTMVGYLREDIKDRSDALSNIMKQLRYLNSFKDLHYSHLFLLLEGEALYVNSVLIALLFNFGDEKTIVPYFQEALDLWCEFLTNAPQYYRERWNKLSDHSIDF